MILRSVLTEMEKPFCEEDCPEPLPLPRRAHTDRAEIIRQRRREYGAFPVEETPHLSLNWIGYFPCRAISRGAQTPNRVLVVCGAGRGVSSFAVATWQLGSLPPPSSQDHLRHLAQDREGNSHRTSTALSVKSQAQKIVASRASVGTGRRFLAINTWSVRRPTPTILAEISWPPTAFSGRNSVSCTQGSYRPAWPFSPPGLPIRQSTAHCL